LSGSVKARAQRGSGESGFDEPGAGRDDELRNLANRAAFAADRCEKLGGYAGDEDAHTARAVYIVAAEAFLVVGRLASLFRERTP